MKHASVFKSRRFIGTSLITFSFLCASVALAEIVSGTPTTNHSTDVTITQLTLSKPTVATGDLMLANVSVNGGSAAIITAPTGWTQILRTDNDTNVSLVSYWKIAGASEPASYTWSIDHQTTAEGGITPYSGIDVTDPIDTSAGNTGFGTLATTTSVTTSSANDEVVTLFAADIGKNSNAGAYFSTPANTTEKYDITNTPFGPSTAQDEVLQAAAGSTGSMSSTISGGKARDWAAQTIALRMQSPTTLTTGLLDYYKLDGNSTDALGLNNGTDHNSPTYSTANGIINQGAGFNGTDQYITANSINPSTYDSGLSISAWFKPANVVSGVPFNLTQSGVCDTQILFDGFGTIDYRFTESNQHNTGGSYSAGNWYHIVITHSTSTEKIYVNGILQSTDTSATLTNCTTSLGLGAGIDAGNIWPGAMDEVGVWGRELSQSEVTSLYNSGAGDSYPF